MGLLGHSGLTHESDDDDTIVPWATYQIRKIAVGMRRESRERFPRNRGKPSRHASRHVRDARAVMHTGIAN